MLRSPLALGSGHTLTGALTFEANASRGYNIHMSLVNAATGVTHTNTVVSQCALHHFQYTTQSQSYYPQAEQGQPAQQASAGSDATQTPASVV